VGSEMCIRDRTMDAPESVTAAFKAAPPPDFSLTPASTNLTLQPGAEGTDIMTIAGLNGPFGSAIQLTCVVTGPAPMPTCGLSVASVTPGANSATSTLTITASAAAAMQEPTGRPHLRRFLYALWLPLVLGITVVGGSKRIPRRHWILYCFFAVMFISQAGCGGGGSNGTVNQGPKNYTVTVTGSSGATSHSAQVTVTVQ